MLFYFVRHGQTEANRKETLAGSGLDFPLNETGHAQARRLGEALKDTLGHPLTRVVASDMIRARQTATYLASALGLPLQIHRDLREWHLGEWEGRTFTEYGHLILGNGEPQQGEPRKTFYSRVERAWQEIHSAKEPYLIVSHGAVWLALQDLLNIPRFAVNNCDLVKVHSQDDAWAARVLPLK